jgi:hypothetical protein
MGRPIRWTLLLLACAACGLAQAQAPVAARVNGVPLYQSTVDAMLYNAPAQQGKPTPAKVLDTLVTNRLLATWVRNTFSTAQLYPAAGVGFAREVAQDDQLVGTLRSMHGQQIEAELRSSLNVTGVTVAPVQLERLFGTPGQLRLDYAVDAAHVALAREVPLLRYAIGTAPIVTLTMHDVLRRQNVQGRMEFFNRNTEFIQQQARLLAAHRFVLDWAARHLGAGAVTDLRQALADQDDVRAAMALYGLLDGAEAESPVQAALVRQVSAAEIRVWYGRHREQFKTIARVKARHIQVPDEALANEVLAAAASGQDFAQLAKRHSRAADAASGGDLGWVHQTSDPGWLASLALLQPEGVVSQPFRAAVGAGQAANWEILLVEKRIETYHKADSETVRYLARKAIARERARAQFEAARTQAMRGAVIDTGRAS